MTETLGNSDFSGRLNQAMTQFGGFLAKAGFGIFVLFAILAALVAASFIGLLLAIAAVFLTFASGLGRSKRRTDEPLTLDATQTADGWIIEPGRR